VGVAFPACVEDCLGVCPGVGADDRLVGVGDGGVAEGEFAEVDAVGQRAEYLVARPGAAGGGAVPTVVKGLSDGAGAEPVAGVETED
jgi:hypothetical protein